MPLTGDRTPIPVAELPSAEYGARISPDGRWIAYVSEETGRQEVYVAALPPGSGRWQVSASGGANPNWRRNDGRELFYLQLDGTLTSVDVLGTATSFAAGAPKALFRAARPGNVSRNRYEVAGDGQSFLVGVPVESERAESISVVLNWDEAIRRRAGRGQ